MAQAWSKQNVPVQRMLGERAVFGTVRTAILLISWMDPDFFSAAFQTIKQKDNLEDKSSEKSCYCRFLQIDFQFT